MTSDQFDSQVEGVAALADPLRRSLYRYVVSQPGPVGRDDAANAIGVPRHVAAFHLDRLEQDGLLQAEFRRPEGRTGPGAGRPSKLYRRSAREFAVTLPERRYAFAGRLMAEAIARAERDGISVADALHEAATRMGHSMGEESRLRAGNDAAPDQIEASALQVLAENGYEPRSDATGITLSNCPFHSLAQDYTDLVCGMNFDLIKGLLDGLSAERLEAHLEPAAGRCCVTLRPTPAA